MGSKVESASNKNLFLFLKKFTLLLFPIIPGRPFTLLPLQLLPHRLETLLVLRPVLLQLLAGHRPLLRPADVAVLQHLQETLHLLLLAQSDGGACLAWPGYLNHPIDPVLLA